MITSFSRGRLVNRHTRQTFNSVNSSYWRKRSFAADRTNDRRADGVDGSCTIGVIMRHTAVVMNCLRGTTL